MYVPGNFFSAWIWQRPNGLTIPIGTCKNTEYKVRDIVRVQSQRQSTEYTVPIGALRYVIFFCIFFYFISDEFAKTTTGCRHGKSWGVSVRGLGRGDAPKIMAEYSLKMKADLHVHFIPYFYWKFFFFQIISKILSGLPLYETQGCPIRIMFVMAANAQLTGETG